MFLAGITLENDVFPWLGSRLGKRFYSICKSLPGERIKKEDIDAAEYECRGDLSGVIAKVSKTFDTMGALAPCRWQHTESRFSLSYACVTY
jgi:hypothetical protein